jgi:hypothetical protein
MTWCDPPAGWKYGFPKMWDGEGDYFKWLVAEGYPQAEIDKMGKYFFSRYWEASEEDVKRFDNK